MKRGPNALQSSFDDPKSSNLVVLLGFKRLNRQILVQEIYVQCSPIHLQLNSMRLFTIKSTTKMSE